jgi:hypothetical protein
VTGLEVNAEKAKYVVMFRDQHAGKNHNIKRGNKSFQRVVEFKYLGTTLTNQSSIHEEIKSRLKLGNVCCHPMQNLLSSRLLSKNTKIRVYRTIILPVVLYGCETWSLTLREEQRLRVSVPLSKLWLWLTWQPVCLLFEVAPQDLRKFVHPASKDKSGLGNTFEYTSALKNL